jgi:D-alanyl-D-alanine carboxypeptidase
MASTRFANCHGLMNRRNYSCSNDLIRLCVFAMQRSDFKSIVSKTCYTCSVVNKKYLTQRTLSWRNTNKLLKL